MGIRSVNMSEGDDTSAILFFQIRCKIRDLITVKTLPNVGIMTQTPTQRQVQNQVFSQNELQVRLSRFKLFCDVRVEVLF